jgi:DNA-binding PadR family transcriptional regulator
VNQPSDPILDLLPLREPTFFILLSLAQGEKHGYVIMKDVEALSSGKVKLSTGTLYEALARLLDQELIQRIDAPEPADESRMGEKHPGKPRKAYRLTHQGLRVLKAETARMQNLVAAAQQRLGKKEA